MEGVSFLIRARNEEETLEACIRSLFDVKVPYEIVVILHRCTDQSPEIAERLSRENERVRVYKYEVATSRAGYETLATDEGSPHSFITYSNWCLSKARFLWTCKWDADFLMTPELIAYINRFPKWGMHSKIIKLYAKNSESAELGEYFSSCLNSYKKDRFWEIPYYLVKMQLFERIELADVHIRHVSELKQLKSYWKEEPWYRTEDSEEARIVRSRMERLVREFGEEPPGLARSCNPECASFVNRIVSAAPSYVHFTR